MAQDFTPDESTPPEVSARDDCGNPHRCICQADEPCQWPLLDANTPAPREDVEMPERGV